MHATYILFHGSYCSEKAFIVARLLGYIHGIIEFHTKIIIGTRAFELAVYYLFIISQTDKTH